MITLNSCSHSSTTSYQLHLNLAPAMRSFAASVNASPASGPESFPPVSKRLH